MEIRDPVHGFIDLDDAIEPLLNLPVVQRLRRIKQLAMTSLVYPGANHTRFEHSLGCMHVASRLSKSLRLDETSDRTVKVAALLHDIGHGPFSHVSEQLFEEVNGNGNGHEQIAAILITHDADVKEILNSLKVPMENILKLIMKPQMTQMRTAEHDIVNGPLDADKLDYLLRGSYYTGVKYGLFDLERIINTVKKKERGSESRMVISEDGFWAVEQLLIAKYHMNSQVYSHRVRLITDAMLIRAVQIALNEGDDHIKGLLTISDTDEFYKRYLELDDEKLRVSVLSCKAETSREYVERLMRRDLLKLFYRENLLIYDAFTRDILKSLSPTQLRQVELSISNLLKRQMGKEINPELIIVNRESLFNPTFRSPSAEITEEDILWEEKTTRETRTAPEFRGTIIGEIKEKSQEFINVYVALDDLDKASKEALAQCLKEDITQIFKEVTRRQP